MKKKILALLMVATLVLGGMSMLVMADDAQEMVVLLEENFDEYEADVDISATLLSGFFKYEANSIGDGWIRVQEDASGNLYLKSHVFTQIFNDKPILGAHVFSVDVSMSHLAA